MAGAELPVEKQRMAAFRVMPPKDLAPIMKENKILARIKITPNIEKTKQWHLQKNWH